jgi:hypothetical protein
MKVWTILHRALSTMLLGALAADAGVVRAQGIREQPFSDVRGFIERSPDEFRGISFGKDPTEYLRFLVESGFLPTEGFRRFLDDASASIDRVPIPSGSTSVSYRYDPVLESFARLEQPLSPSLSQVAQTNGARMLTIAASSSSVRYTKFDGLDRGDVILTSETFFDQRLLTDVTGRQGLNVQHLNFKLTQSIWAFSVQYGLFENFDVGIFVPIIDQEFRARSVSRFFLRNPDGSVVPADPVFDRPFSTFNLNDSRVVGIRQDPLPRSPRRLKELELDDFARFGNPAEAYTYDKDSTGLGDIALRFKYFALGTGLFDVGGLLGLSLPSGDEDAFLGTGSVRVDPRIVVSSATTWIVGFTNFGYHWDTEEGDRDRFDYSVGASLKLLERVAIVAEQLGRIEISGSSRVEKFDVAPGIKINPFGEIVVGMNAIIPLNNDEGLGSAVIPNVVADISMSF